MIRGFLFPSYCFVIQSLQVLGSLVNLIYIYIYIYFLSIFDEHFDYLHLIPSSCDVNHRGVSPCTFIDSFYRFVDEFFIFAD